MMTKLELLLALNKLLAHSQFRVRRHMKLRDRRLRDAAQATPGSGRERDLNMRATKEQGNINHWEQMGAALEQSIQLLSKE